MNRRPLKPRSCWEDRYRTPTVRELRDLLSRQHCQLLDAAREALLTMDGVIESIEWRGIPWRWTMAFHREASAVAYLVPQPARPRIGVPLSDELVQALSLKRLSKSVRDAITFAPRVGEMLWPAWDLTSRTQIDELLGLVRRKHELMLSPTAAAGE
jgi:hypothetical protein